ncbi:MAG: four helix bundle protein [Candidatus Yonathbacteria bacterium]|nr:four helix bundle protein [Candidatus Yonathbacteria bacterium]NTW47899.1 four helix bundle protein [Candidatus Yonathbacteria bacterium]
MNYETRNMKYEAPAKIITFRDLNAWKLGHNLVLQVYRMTRFFPKEEMFGLSSQMRRSAISITSNIAEGFGRQSIKDKIHFYTMARGSLTELQNQLIIAHDIGILDDTSFTNAELTSVDVHKIINGLIKTSRNHPSLSR